jgi:hypothetical protein
VVVTADISKISEPFTFMQTCEILVFEIVNWPKFNNTDVGSIGKHLIIISFKFIKLKYEKARSPEVLSQRTKKRKKVESMRKCWINKLGTLFVPIHEKSHEVLNIIEKKEVHKYGTVLMFTLSVLKVLF